MLPVRVDDLERSVQQNEKGNPLVTLLDDDGPAFEHVLDTERANACELRVVEHRKHLRAT